MHFKGLYGLHMPTPKPEPRPFSKEEPRRNYHCASCAKVITRAQHDKAGGLCAECKDWRTKHFRKVLSNPGKKKRPRVVKDVSKQLRRAYAKAER